MPTQPTAPLLRAFHELRAAFLQGGVPARASVPTATNDEAARQIAFWARHEVGHALGERCRGGVGAIERAPGRITLELSVEPAAHAQGEPS